MGSIKSNLQILPATVDDIPTLVDVWFKAFSIDPGMMQLFPDTPNMRKWMAEYHALDFATKPYQYYMKVVDPEIIDEHGSVRVLAYGKWDTAMPNIRGPRFPPWDSDTPGTEATKVFDGLNESRDRVMGDLKHYCKSSQRRMGVIVFFFFFGNIHANRD